MVNHTVEYLKKSNIRLIRHMEYIRRKMGNECLIAKPNFSSSSIFKRNFVSIQFGLLSVFYNKPF